MRTAALPIHPTRRHPRTGLALRAIGLHPKTGRPLWPIIGASEDDWSSVFEGKTPEEVKQALDDALAAADKGDDNPWADLFKDQKPEDVKEALDNSRKWETRAKGNKAKADQLDELVKKITGKDDGDPDPEKLAGELTAAQREARATKVENAVLKQSSKHDANPSLLADSRSFMDSIADLDPTADDFTSKVDAAIKKAVEANDALKVGTTTGPRPVRQQGKPSQGKQGGVAAGADIFAERNKRRSSTSS